MGKNYDKKRLPAAAEESGGINPEEVGVAGYSRPPLARMLRLHEWLMANRYPNCRKIAREFEVSAKTVQRDVNFMRDQMRLPIDYDKGHFGFYYTRPVSGFPAMGTGASRGGGTPWRRSMPPAIGEKPALTAGRSGFSARIRFDAESARTVRGRTWHATQVIQALHGGGVELTLVVKDECEVARWVLSWGGHAWVVEPQRLRNRVREMAREILARH
jgi:predicted DNA-binding transcriptional regulator YafY